MLYEWYLQDGWQASPRLTIDYGARFLWYSPYTRPDKQVANFDPSKYDPSKAPLPSRIVPDPSCSERCHTASAVRTGISGHLSRDLLPVLC